MPLGLRYHLNLLNFISKIHNVKANMRVYRIANRSHAVHDNGKSELMVLFVFVSDVHKAALVSRIQISDFSVFISFRCRFRVKSRKEEQQNKKAHSHKHAHNEIEKKKKEIHS